MGAFALFCSPKPLHVKNSDAIKRSQLLIHSYYPFVYHYPIVTMLYCYLKYAPKIGK